MSEAEQDSIFQQWLGSHRALLFKVVRAYARDVMDRDDLFQEISIQVWRSIPSFRRESAVSTWMYRVALNTAMAWVRKQRQHSLPERLEHHTHVLSQNIAEDDRLRWLYDEIARLDTVDRSLVLLMFDGLSYQEMSEVLGISESNVGVKVHRLKKYLTSRTKTYSHGI